MKRDFKLRQLTIAAVMAAAACILGPLSIPLPFTPVPLSLCTLVFYLFSYLLDVRECAAACLVYLLLGFAGLPVFTGFRSGVAVLAGPTGGYLIGYLFICVICPLVIRRWPERRLPQLIGFLAATLLLYALGTAWYGFSAKIGFAQALLGAVVPFLPGDGAKIALAVLLGPGLRRRLNRDSIT